MLGSFLEPVGPYLQIAVCVLLVVAIAWSVLTIGKLLKEFPRLFGKDGAGINSGWLGLLIILSRVILIAVLFVIVFQGFGMVYYWLNFKIDF